MKKNYQSILIIVILIFLLLFYFFHSTLIIQEFLDYSMLFLTKFVPVSFPILLFMGLLIQYPIIDLFQNNAFCLFILSLFSGFPSGTKYTVDFIQKKYITEEEGNKMLLFTHFPNPLFVLGTVSMVLGDANLSKKILFSLILSNFFLFLFSKKADKKQKEENSLPFAKKMSLAIFSSAKTIILIYGTSIFFYFLALSITRYCSISSYLYVFLWGMFDLTKGVFSTSFLENNLIGSYFILFFLSFGNFSIHMQVKSILADTSLSYRFFLIGRVIGTLLSFIIFSLFIGIDLLQ